MALVLSYLFAGIIYVGFLIVCLAVLGLGLYVLALLAGALGLL
jgi:hypothetical protein